MDKVVAAALESLSARVNLDTGLIHPADKKMAVEAFRILWRAWYPLPPSEIERWALSHGWAAEDARELAVVADRVRDGRRFKLLGGGPSWGPDVLEL